MKKEKFFLKIENRRCIMQEDFLTRIRSSYNQFTKAEKRVADFILQNPSEVLFMSISDLAETCRVGDTSVFRFCKTMNLKGSPCGDRIRRRRRVMKR